VGAVALALSIGWAIPTAMAEKPLDVPHGPGNGAAAHIWVDDTTYAATTDARVIVPDPPLGATENYVYAQCWALDGTYLYAAVFPIVERDSVLGPFWTGSTWTTPAPANCLASVVYWEDGGWGLMVSVVSAEFFVSVQT